MLIPLTGAFCFGLVIGWITSRTLLRSTEPVKLSDIATVIGAVGGGGVTALFKGEDLFGMYAIGLAVGFFLYLVIRWAAGGGSGMKNFMAAFTLRRDDHDPLEQRET